VRAIYLTHPTRAKQGEDFVGAETRARRDGHVGMAGILPRRPRGRTLPHRSRNKAPRVQRREALAVDYYLLDGRCLHAPESRHPSRSLPRDPILAPLRTDARFEDLVARMWRDVEAQRQRARERGLFDLQPLIAGAAQ
jgi:hypothetical protein